MSYNTKLQISAELLGEWTEKALASSDAVDIIDDAIIQVPYDHDDSVDDRIKTLISLHHARTQANIGLVVFARLMRTEVRIALKYPEPLRSWAA